MTIPRLLGLLPTLLVSALGAAPTAVAAPDSRLQVIELFTSQGCYSCPPADALLGEMINAGRGIIGLEFHVDYWDDLTYGRAGKWKDPFSDSRYTQRQRAYHAQHLSGRRGIYTPQAVINGRFAAVGTNRGAIDTALNAPSSAPIVNVTVRSGTEPGFSIVLDGDATQAAAVWLLIFDRHRVTEVPNGENHGKTLRNFNVVREMRRIGDWPGGSTTLSIDEPAVGERQGCAVLVQDEHQGPILGASLC